MSQQRILPLSLSLSVGLQPQVVFKLGYFQISFVKKLLSFSFSPMVCSHVCHVFQVGQTMPSRKKKEKQCGQWVSTLVSKDGKTKKGSKDKNKAVLHCYTKKLSVFNVDSICEPNLITWVHIYLCYFTGKRVILELIMTWAEFKNKKWKVFICHFSVCRKKPAGLYETGHELCSFIF